MYTSYIGKKFLALLKEKYRKPNDYSAHSFFDEVMFPLFFDDEKHFLNVANSSFFQPISKTLLSKEKSVHQLRLERFHMDINTKGASLTTLIGYAAQGVLAGTSGQVSNLQNEITLEDMYASWIGGGMAIAVGGGYSILIDNAEILWGIFIGWTYYRSYLNQTPNLKGNQIDIWNAYWIIHFLSKKFNLCQPLSGFYFPEYDVCKVEKWRKMGFVEFSSEKWSKILFNLSKRFPNEIITVNCFKFADTNTTIGFINLYLPEISEIYELRDKLFIDYKDTILKDEQIEKLETFFTFKNACKLGSIGLKSIEPAKLRDYMPKGSIEYARGEEFKFTNENSYINYSLYKLWMIAMLNKTELLELATRLAKSLLSILETKKKEEDNRWKTNVSQGIEEVKNAKNLRSFIEALTPLIEVGNAELYANVVEQVLKMPVDNFPLFITLVRFEYAYLKSKE